MLIDAAIKDSSIKDYLLPQFKSLDPLCFAFTGIPYLNDDKDIAPVLKLFCKLEAETSIRS